MAMPLAMMSMPIEIRNAQSLSSLDRVDEYDDVATEILLFGNLDSWPSGKFCSALTRSWRPGVHNKTRTIGDEVACARRCDHSHSPRPLRRVLLIMIMGMGIECGDYDEAAGHTLRNGFLHHCPAHWTKIEHRKFLLRGVDSTIGKRNQVCFQEQIMNDILHLVLLVGLFS
jgi:hypothetical protein